MVRQCGSMHQLAMGDLTAKSYLKEAPGFIALAFWPRHVGLRKKPKSRAKRGRIMSYEYEHQQL
jgi:hypothetical protein